MNAPSTAWREQVAPDEAERFAGHALHRKQRFGLAARFEVPGGLPAQVRHGGFGTPKSFDPWAALAERRPRGDVMRARCVVGLGSQTQRRAG